MREGLKGLVEHLAVRPKGWKWGVNCFLMCVVASWIVIVSSGWWLFVGLFAYAYVLSVGVMGLVRGYGGFVLWAAVLWSGLSVIGVTIQLAALGIEGL